MMDAVKEKQSYVFDHKLSDEEIRELIDNFDYDAWLEDFDDDAEPMPVWDSFGNPTRDTIAAKYESVHDIDEESMTIDEFHDWLNEMIAE